MNHSGPFTSSAVAQQTLISGTCIRPSLVGGCRERLLAVADSCEIDRHPFSGIFAVCWLVHRPRITACPPRRVQPTCVRHSQRTQSIKLCKSPSACAGDRISLLQLSVRGPFLLSNGLTDDVEVVSAARRLASLVPDYCEFNNTYTYPCSGTVILVVLGWQQHNTLLVHIIYFPRSRSFPYPDKPQLLRLAPN